MSAANIAAIAAELVIMICGPIAAALWIRRRFAVPRRVFWIAAGFFLANLAVNVPLVVMVWPSLFGAGSWALLAATAMTYAVCEEIARYLSFRAGRSMRENRTAGGALAAGVGHGVAVVAPASAAVDPTRLQAVESIQKVDPVLMANCTTGSVADAVSVPPEVPLVGCLTL
ncbi:YhfC family glutamic-type intramembrane protease [Saccharopolyspora sp. NPDC050642]|uniref:YhfC family glutamic-type intramembrane protease n=1 Tax=Saccharopolyspora sp. NPDC050642 TaxID=3157099 RepID=UPI00340B1F51